MTPKRTLHELKGILATYNTARERASDYLATKMLQDQIDAIETAIRWIQRVVAGERL